MLKDKILEIVELHKQIRKLISEINDISISEDGAYWCLPESISLGKEDIESVSKDLNIESEILLRDCPTYPSEIALKIGGVKFYSLNRADV